MAVLVDLTTGFGAEEAPPGTTIGLYAQSIFPAPTYPYEASGAPPGPAAFTAKVNESGSVTFKGTKLGVFYFTGYEKEGTWHYRECFMGDYWHAGELKDDLSTLEAAVLKLPSKVEAYTQTFSTAGRTHAEAELATNLPTNLNVLTTLLGSLVGEVNVANKRTNEIAKALNEQKKLVNALIDDLQATGIAK